jgi:hypothetical protein
VPQMAGTPDAKQRNEQLCHDNILLLALRSECMTGGGYSIDSFHCNVKGKASSRANSNGSERVVLCTYSSNGKAGRARPVTETLLPIPRSLSYSLVTAI